jgi:IclR family pca regulon transcriptional regulator
MGEVRRIQVRAALPEAESSSLFVQSVEKAMKVLMAFDGSKRHLSLSEIAALTQLDNSAAQRFSHTLTALGYLVKDSATRKYELSVRLLDFTYHYLASNEMVQRAAPVLQRLARETEEVCNLTVPEGVDIVFVLRIISRNVLNPNVIVGTRLPAYCTAPGLAMMSTWPQEDVEVLLGRSDLVKHTPSTITDAKKIKARLALIRKTGYACTRNELYPDDISTAAPILAANGRAIGALNIAVSRARWNEKRDEQRFADLLCGAAASISAPRLPHRKV